MANADADALSFELKLGQIITPKQIDELLDLLGGPPCE
jgi:hypothetical protein